MVYSAPQVVTALPTLAVVEAEPAHLVEQAVVLLVDLVAKAL
jgi:hypothetical protein